MLGIDPSPAVLSRFSLFIDELMQWNGKTNLIGPAGRTDVVVRHVLDSLTAYGIIKGRKEPILDIGAGAGFPSMPLAIVDGGLTLHAAERRKKRALFLQSTVLLLRLENVTVIDKDVRELRDRYGIVTSRGVGELAELVRLSERVLEERGMIIAFKGKMSEVEKEVARLKGRAGSGKNLTLQVQKVVVPHLEEEERTIVIIETK